jgi:hypothetical protein
MQMTGLQETCGRDLSSRIIKSKIAEQNKRGSDWSTRKATKIERKPKTMVVDWALSEFVADYE